MLPTHTFYARSFFSSLCINFDREWTNSKSNSCKWIVSINTHFTHYSPKLLCRSGCQIFMALWANYSKLQVLDLLLCSFQYFNKGICNLFFKGICDPVQAHFITLEDQSESVDNRRVVMSQWDNIKLVESKSDIEVKSAIIVRQKLILVILPQGFVIWLNSDNSLNWKTFYIMM